jgi:dihydroneopterin aldolase
MVSAVEVAGPTVATIFVRLTGSGLSREYGRSVDRILISGIRELGVHGVLPEEQTRPQPFEVDLELFVDLAPAGVTDELSDTVDYGAICEAVSKIVSSEHYQLLERLATRIGEVCRADPRVQRVVVEVRKMEPPVRAAVGWVGVRVER